MKRPHLIVWGGVALSALCALVALFCALHVWFATSLTGSPALTTDEILACLTLVVTLVAVVVAVAAIGIGMAAIFGYAELRAITLRKTEEQLHKMIDNLQASGDLPAATAAVLRTSIAIEPEPPLPHTLAQLAARDSGTKVTSGPKNRLAREYPKAEKED